MELIGDMISLLQVGDWGRRGQYNQSHVAAMMGLKASLLEPDFVISVGDNFYPSKAQLRSHIVLGSDLMR